MPSPRSKPRKAPAVKEIIHPPATREPMDLQRYGGQWVAIWRREIVDSDKDFDRLWKRLRRKGLHEKAQFLRLPRPGVYLV